MGIAAKMKRGAAKIGRGWLRNEARDPAVIFLGLALWWDLRRDLRLFRKHTASNFEKVFETNFEKVFKTLDPLVNETKDQRGLAASTAL